MLLALTIYGGFAALTLAHDRLPWWAFMAAGAWIIAWHSSLQHEVLHGHPTRWRSFNRLLGFIPLSLWMPYERYRVLHLAHHRDERLTDPVDDPESYYWEPDDWRRLGALGRGLVRFQSTLIGRLTVGPAWSMLRFFQSEFRLIRGGDRVVARMWGEHLAGVAAVAAWLWGVCGLDPVSYFALVVYPGTALLSVRSFAEHRAEDAVGERTAIVEGSRLLGLLFLFNNLHAAHHANPTLPWYALPGWYRAKREELIAANGGLVYRGYLDVFRRFLWRPHDRPLHPRGRAPLPGGAPGE